MNEKRYHFIEDSRESSHSQSSSRRSSLTVTIQEDLDNAANDNYGCYTWICAPALAQFVWRRRHLLEGRRVLEIGSGAALPGIVAGLCGDVASLTLADSRAFHPAATRLARRNADANGLAHARVIDVTWGLIGPEMMEGSNAISGFDVVLASDCFYDTHNFEDVVFTIATLLQPQRQNSKQSSRDAEDFSDDTPSQHRSPFAPPELWMSYQERSSGRSIRHLLAKYRLRCVEETSWREFFECIASKAEKKNLEWLNHHHQIHSVWILVLRHEEAD